MKEQQETTSLRKCESESVETQDVRSTLSLAIEKGVDPVTLGKLMDLQERWEANQARKAFVDAMAGFKRECPAVIGKDKTADYGQGKAKYSYATTGAILTAITPSLSKFGLSISWETKQEARLVTVTCHVTHSGGHRESATLTGPHDESGGKNPIQTLGSSVHYLQRYTLVSALGLATADMDDPDNSPDPIKRATMKQPQPQAVESANSFVGVIEDVKEIHSKADAPKPWTKWGVVCGGETYGTFDKTLGDAATVLKGCEAAIEWREDGKYKVLTGIKPHESSVQDDALPL